MTMVKLCLVVVLASFAQGIKWQSLKKFNPFKTLNGLASTTATIPVSTPSREALNVRIDDSWIDLSGWRKAHPAGDHWIDMYKGRDATEVMYAFHSDSAMQMMQRLPKSKTAEGLEEAVPKVTEITRNFRKLREQLVKDGWWERDMLHEARLFSIWASLFASGLFVAKGIPLLGVFLLALANTSAGWIGHDYIHGTDKFSFRMRNFASLAAGMSPTWWSDKHNKHHAVPNEVGVDEDLATDPALYVYAPTTTKDSPLRKFQHFYVPIAFSWLFAIWRIDSAKVCIKDALSGFKRKTQWESVFQLAHYALMAAFVPLPVFLGSVFFAGLVTAIIVTVTHQSEDLFWGFNPDFVLSQFLSTRNAKCNTLFSDWLWGGMQWQLEHHLFPSMPRSKYPALSGVIQKFASENGLEYRITEEFALIRKNWDMYKRVAEEPSRDQLPFTDISPNNVLLQ